MKTSNILNPFLKTYLKNRPLFLSLIRAKELELYRRFLPAPENPSAKGKILDFGCGDGFFLKSLIEKTTPDTQKKPQIIGLEAKSVADETLKIAEQSHIYQEIKIYGGQTLPFPDQSFKTIFSNCVLEHVNNPEQVLTELYRILAPDGQMYCTVMAKNWENNLLGGLLFGNLYRQWMRQIQIHQNLLTQDEWQNCFKNAGFKITQVVGYLDKKACRWIDFLHYASIGSLITYKFSKRWVLFPQIFDIVPIEKQLAKLVEKDVLPKDAGALFLVLNK